MFCGKCYISFFVRLFFVCSFVVRLFVCLFVRSIVLVFSFCLIALRRKEDRVGDVEITNESIESLARWYAREAGVRNLANLIDKV